MASLGKLTNAFLQASQETTFTLANLNFNFALIKYDAPEEYRGLGASLSTRRKIAAEDGSIHIAARKLTALFQSFLPSVPNLIQAYGVRASEIAALPDVNPKGNSRQGIFADHVGADGTSIWASATSGKDAVTMHLLACMLARIWRREQAIPIWTELVEQRKALLHTSIAETDGPFQVSDLAASRIELSRSELDEWDASARAWLQTADEGQKFRQTQLRLIVDNISLPVSTSNNVYSAITNAWTSAMETLESLIKGAPQRIDNGAILLGLSAWHLYPDILLASTNQHVTQLDPLINPGGIITVGLRNRTEDGKGVVWSLPLTQARYYGEPVMTTRHAGVRESQVSFEESMLVVVGSVLSSWQLPGLDVDDALDLIKIVTKAAKSLDVSPESSDESLNPLRDMGGDDWVEWLSLLTTSIEQYTKSTGIEKENLTRLIKYGQRNCSKLLSSRRSYPAFVFGLTDFSRLLKPFDEDYEAQISLLRKWAIKKLDPQVVASAIIRYRQRPFATYYYTNIIIDSQSLSKRRRTGKASHKVHSSSPDVRWAENDDRLDEDVVVRYAEDGILASSLEPRRDTAYMPPGPGYENVPHSFVCGDPNVAAIYVRSALLPKGPVKNKCMDALYLYRCIMEGDISESHVALALEEMASSYSSHTTGTYFDSLCAIEAASKIYATLRGARVNLQAMSSRVSKAKWWQSMRSSLPNKLQAVMSCIAYFETGGLDVNPEDLGEHAFAVCHATSIFVASRLLGDPIDDALEYSVERIIGNVGKPGLAFLITPPDPKTQHFDPASWHLIAHEKFDGKVQDSFQGTSFHLSFTGYEHPLGVGQRSGRDVPAYLLETAVSVYDKDRWVADLDILSASKHWKKTPVSPCLHPSTGQIPILDLTLVSVDTWLEILDPPQKGQHAVVRANRNPIARLATAALALQRGRRVLILPDKVCWECQGWSVVDSLGSVTEMPFEGTDLPDPLFGTMDSPKMFDDFGNDETHVDFGSEACSGSSDSESSDNERTDSEDGSTKGVDNADSGVFLIY